MNKWTILDLAKPLFKPIPQSDAADVEENIEFWIKNKRQGMLDAFCVPNAKAKTGYSFISASDLDETVLVEITILKTPVKFWVTNFHMSKGSLDPLWFKVYRTSITYQINPAFPVLEFESFAKIKRELKSCL